MSVVRKFNGITSELMSYLPWLIKRKMNLIYFSVVKRKIPDFVLKRGVLFIHIPKAAGISISNSLYGREIGHKRAIDYKRADPVRFSELTKISVVRSPYERLVSAYNFLYLGGMDGYRFDSKFSEFIRTFDSFEDFVFGWLGCGNNKYKYIHFIPQNEFIYFKGQLLVDSYGKLEEIDEYLKYVSKTFGLTLSISRDNATSSKIITVKDVMNNSRLKRKIYSIYRKDFELLGYDE